MTLRRVPTQQGVCADPLLPRLRFLAESWTPAVAEPYFMML